MHNVVRGQISDFFRYVCLTIFHLAILFELSYDMIETFALVLFRFSLVLKSSDTEGNMNYQNYFRIWCLLI